MNTQKKWGSSYPNKEQIKDKNEDKSKEQKRNDDKKDIERIKKLLGEKIKDPNLARKAALIISEMIKPK